MRRIVLGGFELLDVLVFAKARGHHKAADIILSADGRDEIRQRQMGGRLRAPICCRARCAASAIGTFRPCRHRQDRHRHCQRLVGGPETNHGLACSHSLDDSGQHLLGVVNKSVAALPTLSVAENGRDKGPASSQVGSNGVHAHVLRQSPDRSGIFAGAEKPGAGAHNPVKSGRRALARAWANGQPLAAAFWFGMARAHLLITRRECRRHSLAHVLGQKAGGHATARDASVTYTGLPPAIDGIVFTAV